MNISKMSMLDILAEIKRRNKHIGKLQRRRSALLKKLAAIEQQIKTAGGALRGTMKAAGPAARRRNKTALPEAMIAVMSKDKPMRANEIEQAVIKSGYQSSSANFKTIIFQVLGKDKRFKKLTRGQYVLK